MRAVRIATLVLLFCAAATEARADWVLAAFTGASRTPSNTLTLVGPDGLPHQIGPVDYVGEAWTAPIYYGYRLGWARAGRGLGVEVEFTHAKAIGTTRSTLLTDFQQSHGLNFVLANAVWRQEWTTTSLSPSRSARCGPCSSHGSGWIAEE